MKKNFPAWLCGVLSATLYASAFFAFGVLCVWTHKAFFCSPHFEYKTPAETSRVLADFAESNTVSAEFDANGLNAAAAGFLALANKDSGFYASPPSFDICGKVAAVTFPLEFDFVNRRTVSFTVELDSALKVVGGYLGAAKIPARTVEFWGAKLLRHYDSNSAVASFFLYLRKSVKIEIGDGKVVLEKIR